MVGHNRIRCLVVAVPASTDRLGPRGALARDVLPWADPYVAGLIKKLQDEVREERRGQALVRHYHRPTVPSRIDPAAPGSAGGLTVDNNFGDAPEDDMLFAQ